MAYISENTSKKKKELEKLELSKPGEYQSQYGDTINSLLDKVVNRKPFSYDFNADQLYQQYKNNYMQQGNQAMMNTMANAATLTGGYGNSYATAAGAQANQQYLNQLNNIIPELYAAAMDKYNMDTDKLMAQYGAVTDAEGRDYSRYQDALTNYQANRGYLYGQYMDAVGQDQYQEQFDYTKSQDLQAYQQWLDQFNYTKKQDEIANEQWESQFEYQKEQDDKAYEQWLEEFNYRKEQNELAKDNQSGSSRKSNSGGGYSEIYGTPYVESEDGSVNKTQVTPLNKIADFTAVSNKAKEKAKVSNEALASYLATQVNNGAISQFDADRIYSALVDKKESSTKGSGGNSTTSVKGTNQKKTISMR